jgi:hypothetical protein
MICTEINTEELYTGAGLFKDLRAFLESRGFECVSSVLTERNWGDALFVRRRKETPIVFICHDQKSVDLCLQKDSSAICMLVGPAEITVRDPARTIIVRHLPHNIECHRKLLTFTAWYAIIKNNLFPNDSHICILEWDTVIHNKLFNHPTTDIVAFLVDDGRCFQNDIRIPVLQYYLQQKGLDYTTLTRPWICTTNHCIKRSVLAEFVDWYYPSCVDILHVQDPEKVSWYHERLFWIFVLTKQYTIQRTDSVSHVQAGSHQHSFNKS